MRSDPSPPTPTDSESTPGASGDPEASADATSGPRPTFGGGPVRESERIDSLDVLRGFALLGILTMNIGGFAMPGAAYFNPTAWGSLDGLDGLVYRLTHVLADLKFMAIFSMLFGAGIVLMSERRRASGQKTAALHYRRMFWLLAFGMAHAYLIWYGDILVAYAICGSVVYLVHRLRPRWLLTLSVVFLSLASLIMLGAGLSLPQWPEEGVEAVRLELDPPPEVLAAEVAAYRGGFSDQMTHRVPQARAMQTQTFAFFMFWRVTGLMLLGMALFKLGVFSAKRSARFYRTWIGLGLLIGVPVIVWGMMRDFAAGYPMPESFFLGIQFNYWGSLLVALGWVGAVMLLCQSALGAGLKARLAAVGRTAFTNYILQSVLCTFLFYGHGLGLFGRVERLGQAGVVLAVWALQLWISPLWLERFRFGPLEWLWRTLSYGRVQPFRRA